MKSIRGILIAAIFLFISIGTYSQNFVPASSVGSGNPDDITNDVPQGKVGIGLYMTYPDPFDPLTVGGDISLYPDDDGIDRNIWGRTDGGIFSLYSGLTPTDGSAIRLYGAGSPSGYGKIGFSSYNYNTTGVGFEFNHYDANGSGGYVSSFVIDKYANARVGVAAPMTTDRLTVDGSVYVYDPDDHPRGMLARSYTGQLDLFSGSSLTDGTSINLFAQNHSANRGRMFFNAPELDGVNFKWRSVNGSTIRDKMVLDINGLLHLSNHVRFDLASQYSWNYIQGYKSTAVLAIMANTGSNDGAGIELNGPTTQASPGMMTLCSYGAHPTGFSFINTSTGGTVKNLMNVSNNGNLHVANDIIFDLSAQNTWDYIQGYKTNGVLAVMANSGSNDGSGIEFSGSSAVGNPGSMALFVNGDNPAGTGFDFVKYASGTNTSLMNIQKNGKVRIGTSSLDVSSNDYNLFVEKGIMTERIRVAIKSSIDWYDEVFNGDYNLRSLDEVSSYIKANKHLPDIPSADEVVKEGIDLGEMNALLLKKIEELTLYVLQQQKDIELLKAGSSLKNKRK